MAEVHAYAIRQLVELSTLTHYTASVIRQRSFTASDSEKKFAHRPIYEYHQLGQFSVRVLSDWCALIVDQITHLLDNRVQVQLV